MKFKYIVAIIFIALFSMIGLIVVQINWMSDSYRLEQKSQENSIYEALSDALNEYEKEASMKYFNEGSLIAYPNSLRPNSLNKQKETVLNFNYKDTTSGFYKMLTTELHIPNSMLKNMTPDQQMQLNEHYKNFNEEWKSQAKLLFFESTCVDEKIDPKILRAIITKYLEEHNVKLPFEICILDQSTSGFIYSDFKNMDSAILQKSIKSQLFQNSIFNQSAQLYINFPCKDERLMDKMAPLFAVSFVFITLILLAFLITIYTIYAQKKLGDMKTDFINNMTHELKTPVATIGIASKMIQNPKIIGSKEKVSQYAKIIKQENDRLLNNIEKVLQAARYSKSEVRLKIMDLDINEIASEVVSQVKLNVEEVGGEITFFADADPSNVEGDKIHVTNMVNNLIENAIKYRKENEQLRIHVETKNNHNGIDIIVEDNGIGISNDVLEKIFEKFYRVPMGNIHNVKGFGLGLNYVKEMVEAHDGYARATSVLGQGSIFTIHVPYKYSGPTEFIDEN